MRSQARAPDITAGDVAATIGAEHVRLSYHYLDQADMEGYMSLLDPEARLHHPGHPVSRGPDEAAAAMESLAYTRGRHRIFKTVSEGDTVAAIGRFTGSAAPFGNMYETEFVDVFTLSGHGLLLSCRRFCWNGRN